MKTRVLSPKQKEVHDFIVNYANENQGETPTIKTIAKAFNISGAFAYNHMKSLMKKGYLKNKKVKKRALTPMQATAVKLKLENPNLPNSKILRKSGYAKTSATTRSTHIFNDIREALEESGDTERAKLLSRYIPEQKVYETIGAGLDAASKWGPDWNARLKAAEMGAKIHGIYTDSPQTNIVILQAVQEIASLLGSTEVFPSESI